MKNKITSTVLICLSIVLLILAMVYVFLENSETKKVDCEIITLTNKTDINKKSFYVTVKYDQILYDKQINEDLYNTIKIGTYINTEIDIFIYKNVYIAMFLFLAGVVCLYLAEKYDD